MTKDQQAIFSQRDLRWSRQKIGSSVCTIESHGCTITAICRALFIHTGIVMTPAQIVLILDFDSIGRILWYSLAKIGLKATRGWGKPKEFKKGMLIELDYRSTTGLMHWVTFESVNPDGKTIQVMDPWTGSIEKRPISNISGFTLIEALNTPKPEPTEWEKEVMEAQEWVKKHGISNGERPRDFVTREEQWVMTHRLAKKIIEWTSS